MLVAVMLLPALIEVAPVRLLPFRVTATVVLCKPEVGEIDVSVDPCTVNVAELEVPLGVVTVTFLLERLAPFEITNVAVILLELTTLKLPLAIETPAPRPPNPVAPVKLVPVKVTGTLVPRTPVLGAIEVNVGTAPALTVNVTVFEVPIGVVTLML